MSDTPWFDPSQPFNFEDEQRKIARQRQMAQFLASQTSQPQGQIVPGGPHGFYVAPNALAHMMPAVMAYLSGMKEDEASNAESRLAAEQSKRTVDLAKEMESLNLRGTPAGTVMDDEYGTQPVFHGNPSTRATQADRMELYQKGLNIGSPMAKLLIERDYATSNAKPTYDEVDTTKDVYVTDPRTGLRTLVKAGQPKKSEFDLKVDAVLNANPKLTRAQAVDLAMNNIGRDEYNNTLYNKREYFTGAQAPGSALPQATGAAAIPPRGQTFTGPGGATASPVAPQGVPAQSAAPAAPSALPRSKAQLDQEKFKLDADKAKADQEKAQRDDTHRDRVENRQTQEQVSKLTSEFEAADTYIRKVNRVIALLEEGNKTGLYDGAKTMFNAQVSGDPKATELQTLLESLQLDQAALIKGQGTITDQERAMLRKSLPGLWTSSEAGAIKLLKSQIETAQRVRSNAEKAIKNLGADRPIGSWEPSAEQKRAPLVFK